MRESDASLNFPSNEEIVPETRKPVQEFAPIDDEPDDDVQRQRLMQPNFSNARQISLDAADDMQM
jgi:type IV secretion system protein VirD4